MKVLELKQYLQVRGISVMAKRREELLTFLFAIYTIYVFLSHDQFAFRLLHIELHRFRLHTVLAKY